MIIYDNLEINSEILTGDNIEDYDIEKLGLKVSQIKAIKEYKKVILLNYYTIKGEFKECKISLDYIDNKLVY